MKDAHGDLMVVEVDTKDKYAPRKTGVYNVFLQEREVGKKTQLWTYHKNDKTIHSVSHKSDDTVLLMGNNHNMATYKNKQLDSQHFDYNPNNKHLISGKTKWAVEIDQGALDHRGNIGSNPESKSFFQKWDIIYADTLNPNHEDHGHDDHDEKPSKDKRSITRSISAK